MTNEFNREVCPDRCRYKSNLAPFCGYCIVRIMREKEVQNNADGENKSKDLGQADR